MIRSINRYTLDTDIHLYGDSLCPFSRNGYEWARTWGKVPIFKGEKYYWTMDLGFLGRDCNESMVSAINEKIYKIAYHFHDEEVDPCMAIREKVYLFIAATLGKHTEIQEFGPNHKIALWQTQDGNVIMEAVCLDTEIILTSSSIRNAKKISIFGRLFARLGI